MFLFHYYHFHHSHYDDHCLESSDHEMIRHACERASMMRKIHTELMKIGYYDNMDEQHYLIYNY